MKNLILALLISLASLSYGVEYKGVNIDNIPFKVFGYHYKYRIFFDGVITFKGNKAFLLYDFNGKMTEINITNEFVESLTNLKLYDSSSQSLVVIAIIREEDIEDTASYECHPNK